MRYTVCVPVHTIQMRVQSTLFCYLRRIVACPHWGRASVYLIHLLKWDCLPECPLHIYTGILTLARQEHFSLATQTHSNAHLTSFQFSSRLIYLLNAELCSVKRLFSIYSLSEGQIFFAIQIKNKAAINNQSQVVV